MSRLSSSRARILNRRKSAKQSMLPQASREFMLSREWHNPLRHLTLARAVTLIESYPRGEFADLMWTLGAPYMGIETADADLSAILSRRCNALAEMDWNAKPMKGDLVNDAEAALQAAAVQELMDGIENLYDAIEHLQIALNRGFAHCEILEGPDGTPRALAPVDQWHVVRDGIYGGWRYNPHAHQTNYRVLPAENEMPPDRFVIRTVRRPLGRIALVKFVRANLSEADWGAFTERYGLASGVVTMPPDVRPEDEAVFVSAAQAVAEGGTGALPHGSDYKPNSSDKGSGSAPFESHLDYLTKKLVLVGTNGMLTMLAESGSGTLAGNAHADTFGQLTRGDARAISELMQRQLVEPYLKKRFPGQRISAYWELAFREEVGGSEVVNDAVDLSRAGYAMDAGELAEKTGYKLEKTNLTPADGQDTPLDPVQTRANGLEPEKRVITADDAEGGQNGRFSSDLKNRDSGKVNEDEDEPDITNSETALPDLEAMLAGALTGTSDAWVTALAAAMTGAAEIVADDEDDRLRNRGGFRTLEDGRVIYIDDVETESEFDKKAGEYRREKLSEEKKNKKDEPLDHGVLNTPISKRGITDAQIDREVNRQKREMKTRLDSAANKPKAIKKEAEDAMTRLGKGFVKKMAAKMGTTEKEVTSTLKMMIWKDPAKALEFFKKAETE